MFDFGNTLGDIDKLHDDNINDISLKLMNPCEIFYYMYGIPFKGIPIGNNDLYEITNVSDPNYWLSTLYKNPNKIYSVNAFERILLQHFELQGLSAMKSTGIKVPVFTDGSFTCKLYINEHFTILYSIQNDHTHSPFFIKYNNNVPVPKINFCEYYEVLNELQHTLNYIEYRKIFRLYNGDKYLKVCNKLLIEDFLFYKNDSKAYFIYYTKHLIYIDFYWPENLIKYKNKLEILLGIDYNTINWIADNLSEDNLPVSKHVVINGKDTNITISDKVYDEVPCYVQEIYKSQLGIHKNSKNSEYIMRAIVIDL